MTRMSTAKNQFHAVDWVVFIAVLFVSLSIGIYHAFTGGRQKSNSEYLLGNRNMKLVPVTLSILVSFLSSVLILGYPAEMYNQGTAMWFNAIGMALGAIVAALLFVPLFHPLKLTSVNEYLELRFHSALVKYQGTFFALLDQMIYTGVVIYGPSTAVERATGFPVWASILVAGCVVTAYTTLGGIKGVIWTDVFQAFVMMAGMVAVIVMGCVKVGGIEAVFEENRKNDRLRTLSFDPDPTIRLTFWGVVFTTIFDWGTRLGLKQPSVQRFSSLKTVNTAVCCVLLIAPGIVVLVSLACLSGIAVFAYYSSVGCDPIKAGLITDWNQIVPDFVMEGFNVPGVPGLFIACVWCGALSTASSSLNSSAANVWEDILKRFRPFSSFSETKAATVTKGLVLIFGIISMVVAYAVSQLGGTIHQLVVTFTGTALGGILGLFTLGALIPWSNWKGAFIGGLSGFGFALWIGLGAYFNATQKKRLNNTSIANCSDYINQTGSTLDLWYLNSNTTAPDVLLPTSSASPTIPIPEISGIDKLYRVSFLHVTAIGGGVALLVGCIISLLTCCSDPDEVEAKYLFPFVRGAWCRYKAKKSYNVEMSQYSNEVVTMNGEKHAIR